MRPVTRLFAVTVLAACAWWCMRSVLTVHAQGQCGSFDTSYENPCPTCCLGGTDQRNVTDGFSNGAGMESVTTEYLPCGKSGDCPGPDPNRYCADPPYLVANPDPSCCLPSGSPCNQGTCCDDLICLSNNSCGQCTQNGSYCSNSTDCCSAFCNTDSNTCGFQCGLTDSICSIDSDCCSGSCIDGYCE